jgi:hypothetical protein
MTEPTRTARRDRPLITVGRRDYLPAVRGGYIFIGALREDVWQLGALEMQPLPHRDAQANVFRRRCGASWRTCLEDFPVD